MRKTILICDKCHKETTWLYTMPYIIIAGKRLEFLENGNAKDLCYDCMKSLTNVINVDFFKEY